MWDSKLFKAGVAILLFLLIILVGSQTAFIFRPLIIAVEVFFYSFLISGALYYVLIPLVDWLSNHKIPRSIAVLISYLVFAAVITGLIALIGPSLQQEFTALLITLPDKVDQLLAVFESLKEIPLLRQLFYIDSIIILHL